MNNESNVYILMRRNISMFETRKHVINADMKLRLYRNTLSTQITSANSIGNFHDFPLFNETYFNKTHSLNI